MNTEIVIRQATVDDVPEIVRQRRLMYEAMDYTDTRALSAMEELCAPYLAGAIADGSFRAWLAFSEKQAVGGGAVLVSPWPSHPYDLECRRATILNLYVYVECRRRGVARRLMQTMIEWCEREGFTRVTLHASNDGRPLYESMGFEATNEMRKVISRQQFALSPVKLPGA